MLLITLGYNHIRRLFSVSTAPMIFEKRLELVHPQNRGRKS